MRALPLAAIAAAVGCVPLEERIDIVYQDWCQTSQRVSVECVYDGDTFYVGGCSDSEAEDTIRVLGIQAPELRGGEAGDKADCYGEEASAFLRELLTGKTVTLEYDVECEGVFGRTLAWVWLEGSDPSVVQILEEYEDLGLVDESSYEVLVNELLLRAGYADLYESDVANNIRYTNQLEEARDEAKEEGEGMWGACDP